MSVADKTKHCVITQFSIVYIHFRYEVNVEDWHRKTHHVPLRTVQSCPLHRTDSEITWPTESFIEDKLR